MDLRHRQRDELGRLACTKCGEHKVDDDFPRRASVSHGRSSVCGVCTRARVAAERATDPERFHAYQVAARTRPGTVATREAWRRANPEKMATYRRRQRLKREYGLTPDEYEAMLQAQNGLCKICGGLPVGRGERLHVDHHHDTGRVRGLLCSRCNVMIGYALERPEILNQGADYLRDA